MAMFFGVTSSDLFVLADSFKDAEAPVLMDQCVGETPEYLDLNCQIRTLTMISTKKAKNVSHSRIKFDLADNGRPGSSLNF